MMNSLYQEWIGKNTEMSMDILAIPGASEELENYAADIDDFANFEFTGSDFDDGLAWENGKENVESESAESESDESINYELLQEITSKARHMIVDYILGKINFDVAFGLVALSNANFMPHKRSKSITVCNTLADWDVDDLLQKWSERNPGCIKRVYDSDGIWSWKI